MEYNKEAEGILQRIDKMADDLQRLRREVAQLLVKHTELCAKGESTEAGSTEAPSGERSEISCISSLEELYARDFESDDEPTEHEPVGEPIKNEKESSDSLDDLFVKAGSEEAMEDLFEVRKGFDLLSNLTIADRYLFANELFYGDQAALEDMLREMEPLSSMAHVESYLYDVRKLGRDEEVVKHLLAFVQEHRCK